MNITHFLTLPTNKTQNKVAPIPQTTWNKIIQDVKELLHTSNLPGGIRLHLHLHQGTPLVDSNLISLSPPEAQGSDFVLKRVGDKAVMKIVAKSSAYNAVVGAIMLVVKRHVENAIISCTQGYDGAKDGIAYFEYVFQHPAHKQYPEQANKIVIEFKWLSNIPNGDCAEVLENTRAILKGNATNIQVKLY